MIVVDTSALMAILQKEPEAPDCRAALRAADRVLISAATVTEALIVSACHEIGPHMSLLMRKGGFKVVPLTHATATRAGEAYVRWGKGFHSARLNFGDCFAYALAIEHACPLLYVGNDFAQTDVRSAL